jgi:uncharacterized protein YbaP (TraB family)
VINFNVCPGFIINAMKRLFLFLFGFMTMLQSNAQSANESINHLLWRISGKGLDKPSYLFGTMHLTDRRLFQFGDSLYHALERTEGFAAELDMNNIFTQYINTMVTEEKEKVYVQRLIDKEWLARNQRLLERRFRKPVAEITMDDIANEERKQNARLLESGDMKTFMDAYLFDIANRQGKWTGGIEDPEDQLNLKDETTPTERLRLLFADKSESKKALEWMIETYLKEDLDLIDRSEVIWRGARDAILLKRNIKMAQRIDSLAQLRSCLFAVGAAHLPGDTGLVKLLREKGYTVTPVISSRRVAPEAYKFKEKEKPWVNVTMRDSIYTLQMPVKPLPFKGIETSAIDMQFHFDLGSYSAYFTLGVHANVPTEDMRDTILSRIVKSYGGKGMSVSQKDIMIGKVKGKEIVLKNVFGDYRIQAFVPGDYVALNAVFAIRKNTLFEKDAERFFASFKPAKITEKEKTNMGPVAWKKYEFAGDGFTVSLPAQYTESKEPDSEDVGWKRKSYEVIDLYSQAYYGITVDETMPGYYSDADSNFFETAKENLSGLMNATIIDSMHTTFNGFPAYKLTMKSTEDDSRIITKMFMINRGNRRYGLFLAYDSSIGVLTAGDQFFHSFSILPIQKPIWKNTSAPDNSFSSWSPAPFKLKEDDELESNITRFVMHDTVAAVTTIIDKEAFPPYYWVKSDSTLFEEHIATFIGSRDTVIRRQKIKDGNANGVDIDIWLAESQNIKKMKLLLNGDTLYTIFTFVPAEIVKQGEYDRFYHNFRLTNTTRPKNLFTSKAAALVKELQTGDDEAFELAQSFLEKIEFTAEDLPVLQKALLFEYRDSMVSMPYRVSEQLVEHIIRIDTAQSTVDFIKFHYPKLEKEQQSIKPFLLYLLASLESGDSYKLLKELLIKDPVGDNGYYPFYEKMTESDQAPGLFPGLLQALSDPNIGIHIADLALGLYEKEAIDKQQFIDNKKWITEAAKVHLALKDVEEETILSVTSLVKLLVLINDPTANEWLHKVIARSKDEDTRLEAVIGLLKNKQAVAKNDLLSLAKSDASRIKLYEMLAKQQNLKFFPAEFLSQRWLGQSQLYQWVASDDDPPAKIEYIGERIATYLGEKKKFHLYKIIQYENDPESSHLGVAGPYALDAKNVETTATATQPFIDETFSAAKVNEQFKKFLKEREAENK